MANSSHGTGAQTSDEATTFDQPTSDNSPFTATSTPRSPLVEVLPVADQAADSPLIEIDAPQEDPFQSLGLREDVYKAIKGFGYQSPTAIQAQTVSVILAGRDVIGQAETGSGKTAAFAWPLLSQIDLKQKKVPQILVLAPTRELALQVSAAFEKYGSSMKGLRCVTVYGGQSYETQFRALDRGVHVVVGTPGRIMDHINRKTLDLSQIKTFVLDEADEMLRMGFIDDVEWVMERLPEQRQTVSFSATMPPQIRSIADRHLQDPVHVTIKSKAATADTIDQAFLITHFRDKLNTLTRLMETEETDGVIVFVKTRQTTNVVAEHLVQKGFDAAALNGDIAQNQRERTVNRLKSGKIDILVATDVAARGLDVKRVSHVVNYDFPHDSETYVHRIGRTGRAGREGKAILFVEPKEKRKLGWLEKDTKQKIGAFQPKSIKEINAVRVEKFKARIEASTNDSQMKFFRKLVESMQQESGHEIEDIAAALAVMAQGSTPLLLSEVSSGRDKRGDRGGKRLSDADKTTYRVEVGRAHGAGPGNIVGAIANEAGLHNNEIGKIKMFDRFSTIDLPNDLEDDLMDLLRNLQVSGQRLQISKSDQRYSTGRDRQRRGRKANNGSTGFVKRQRRERQERQSISQSADFAKSKPRSNKSFDGGGRRSANNASTVTSNDAAGESSATGKKSNKSSKPNGKPAKKYIKVRVRK